MTQPDETPHDSADGKTQDEPREDEHTLVVRPARPQDREAVLALCQRVWGEDDYIAEEWDAWLRDEAEGNEVLLVGEQDGQIVGIVHVRMVSPDEGWIEAIRVDPDARRQGVGRTLTSRALVAARERGAVVARLFVDADNAASQALVARFGFTRVAELRRYTAPALQSGLQSGAKAGPIVPLTTPDEADFERIWDWLEQSNLTPFNGGVEIVEWAARALTEPLLRSQLAAGSVRVLEEWRTIQALAILAQAAPEGEPGEEPALDVAYLDGASEGIGRLALALRSIAGERGLARMKLWLPDLLILRDAMAGAGYSIPDDDQPLYLYARDLEA